MAIFCHRFPAWVVDGEPRSWRHYHYGLAYLGRDHLRTQLRDAEAARLSASAGDDYMTWHRDIARRLEVR